MRKLIFSTIYLVFAIVLTNPIALQASEIDKSIQLSNVDFTTIAKIGYIDDESEIILTLENDLRLIIKDYNSIFFETQTVGVRFDKEKLILDLITYSPDGIETGEITFYRVCDNPNWYQAL